MAEIAFQKDSFQNDAFQIGAGAEYSYTANVAVGASVAASKIREVIRAGAVTTGMSVSGSRLVEVARTGTVYIGLAVTASFIKFKEFIAEVTIGMSVTASRLKEIIRTATVAIGLGMETTSFPIITTVNGGHDATGTDHIVSLPSGIVAGNMLLVFFYTRNFTITFPAGWTELFQKVTYNGNGKFGAWYRIADGSEGSTITVTTSSSGYSAHISYRIESYSGIPECGIAVTADSYNPDPPNLSPSWGAENSLWIAACGYEEYQNASGYPADYSGGLSYYSISGAWRQLYAASEDPGTFTYPQITAYAANTVALRGQKCISKRLVELFRTGAVQVGLATTANFIRFKEFIAEVAIGISVSGSRLVEIARTGAVQVGLATTAKRTITVIRAGAVAIGQAITASKVKELIRTGTTAIGLGVSASKSKLVTVVGSVAVGASVTASRLVELIRIGTVTIGEVASAIYTAGLEIIAFVSIGMSVSASKVKELVRVGTTAIGVVVSASWTRVVEGRQLVVKVVTMSYRIVKAATAAYRKIKAITLGE